MCLIGQFEELLSMCCLCKGDLEEQQSLRENNGIDEKQHIIIIKLKTAILIPAVPYVAIFSAQWQQENYVASQKMWLFTTVYSVFLMVSFFKCHIACVHRKVRVCWLMPVFLRIKPDHVLLNFIKRHNQDTKYNI